MKKPKIQYHEHHCHSEFSVGDSTNRISFLAEKSAKRGCKSLTITDHGTLAGTFELQNECKKNGIKPIFGIEAYYVDEYGTEDSEIAYNYAHLILLCKNTTGWINLKNLQVEAWKRGFLRRPRISFEELSKRKEGLIVCSACVRGVASWNLFPDMDKRFSQRSEKERKNLLLSRIRKFKDLFGEDFYLEIQYLDIEDQKIANTFILECAKRFDCKIVATGDCHYLKPKDYRLHDIMICSSRGKTLNDPDNGTYNTHELYFKNTRMIEESWKRWHSYISEDKFIESIRTTNEISEKVGEVELKPKMVCLPKIAEKPHELMNEKLIEGIKKKCTKEQVTSKVYVERLNKEKEVLAKLGMEGYMLVCADIIDLARKAGIPVGPGRGSVAGSLIAYLLDITQIDPIRHNTSFERFLTAERLSLPDIDMDFGREGREKIKELISEKYGAENFAAIMTFMIWKPRGLLKDIGRVQGRSFQDINFVTKAISPRTESFSDKENPLEPSVLAWLDDNNEIKKPAIKLDGIKKQRGIHASGMVLTPTKLEDWVPIAYMTERGSDEKKPVIVSEWDMYALEDLQILKIDLLGLKTLDVIDLCIRRINKKGIKIKDIWKECLSDLENPEIYKMISSGRILGLFQLETSEGMAKLIKDMQPHCFDDIVIALALYRTAIIRTGMLDEYVKRRNGGDFEYLHPSLEPILKSTYGILVYQEQLMEIGVKCAGMTPSESDNFRKATKLKDLEKFKKWEDKFIRGCMENGFEEDIAKELWEWCVRWSDYGFNKSHSSAYALITYVTAWLKFHYPLEFMSSAMSFDTDDETVIEKYVSECRKMKIKVLKPDINKSQERYVIRKGKLISPITSLDKVGNKVYENIMATRKEKKFESFDDFYDRVDKRIVNVRIITNLILGGCFSKIEESIEELFDRFIESRNDKIYRQLFCSDCEKRYPCNIKESESEGTFCPNCGSAEVVFDILSMKGKKFDRTYLANSIYGFSNQENPLRKYVDIIAKHNVGSISELISSSIEEGTMYKIAAHAKRIKLHIDKNGGEMAFVELSDGEDNISLVIFASDWKKIKEDIISGNCYIISALKNRGGLLYLGRNKSCGIIKLGL